LKTLIITSLAIQKCVLFIYFVILSTVFHFFTVDSKNLLLLFYSFFALVILVIFNFRSFPRAKNQELIVVLVFMTISTLLNLESSKITSYFYSIYFAFSFIFFTSVAYKLFTADDYRNLLKALFIIYFVGLLLGQLYVQLNLFTPLSGYSSHLPHGRFGTLIEDGKYRYYSLSTEPSYAAFIVIILYYSMMKMHHSNDSLLKKGNLPLFLMLVYMILFFQSAFGIILLGAMVASYFGFTKRAVLMYLVAFFVFVLISFFKLDVQAIDRVLAIFQKLDIRNLHSLAEVDFTAYFRLAPVLHYLKTIDLTDFHFYLGNGASASRNLIIPETYLAYQGEFLGGFLPSFFYDFGIIGAALVLIFIGRLLPKSKSVPLLIVVLMLFNANFNTQLFWLLLTFLSLNQFYIKNYGTKEVT
jgi:hypothetical protein